MIHDEKIKLFDKDFVVSNGIATLFHNNKEKKIIIRPKVVICLNSPFIY